MFFWCERSSQWHDQWLCDWQYWQTTILRKQWGRKITEERAWTHAGSAQTRYWLRVGRRLGHTDGTVTNNVSNPTQLADSDAAQMCYKNNIKMLTKASFAFKKKKLLASRGVTSIRETATMSSAPHLSDCPSQRERRRAALRNWLKLFRREACDMCNPFTA